MYLTIFGALLSNTQKAGHPFLLLLAKVGQCLMQAPDDVLLCLCCAETNLGCPDGPRGPPDCDTNDTYRTMVPETELGLAVFKVCTLILILSLSGSYYGTFKITVFYFRTPKIRKKPNIPLLNKCQSF